ncbi:hypothetical protein B0I35DRAFT_406183 [Stachybotrys elegans]|uniref:AB hydrolase-1 domain-containing protein n=1 Tax=Stachybotrys elegans TaxID=80388 RepID=A0A8K0SX25_9HYPO|nr:hypothetical protein B0I35DRAFT_406183 [Stachybotrys elegans]
MHPPPLPPDKRRELFNLCLNNVSCMETYLQGWFMGAKMHDIQRDNVREFLLWAFFDTQDDDLDAGDSRVEHELDEYIAVVEKRLGRPLKPGRGPAKSLRLTLDSVHATYRGLTWYAVIFLVDQLTHLAMSWYGFQYHARAPSEVLKMFPPRPQELLCRQRSPTPGLGYWHYPHTDSSKRPVVFFHGIGVGLWTYVRFLREICTSHADGGSVGVIAVELLPVSFRLTNPLPDKASFITQMSKILKHHGWGSYSITSHSFGSVLTTHMIHSTEAGSRAASAVLIDPVTISLHLPSVAYNFTRRSPKRANEWQLWYFASTDPAVALSLGRHFFWRENIMWEDELRGGPSAGEGCDVGREWKAAVCLSGMDLIVDTEAVAQYLADVGGVQVILFPQLDHAQVFDDVSCRQRVVQLVRAQCDTALEST